MKKKITLLGILLSTIFCSSFGQNVSYAYDEAGNRVKREIVLQTRAAEESTNESYSEMLNDRGIRIYPNPTEGQLTVEITGDGACRFDIYNISGQQVLTTNSGPGRVVLDISSQPKGLYILRVTTENGGDSSTTLNIVPPTSIIEQWKIDYENMRLHMIYGESEPFDMLVENLTKLEIKINQIK